MIDVPRFGLGCAPLGNLFRQYSEAEADAILDAAWNAGVRHFDTAPHYGLGLSEQRVGRFLATKPRDEYVLSTKVGRLLREDPSWDGSAMAAGGFVVPARLQRVLDYSGAGVRASVEESLDRLGLDRVDILYVHDPELSGIPGATDSALAALAELRDEGIVAAIGTGSLGIDAQLTTVRTGLADVLMVANRYTLLDQSAVPELVDACDVHGVRIVAAAVFNSGLLAFTPSRDAKYDYEAVPDDVFARALEIDKVCADHGVDLPAAALQYPLLDPRVISVVAGAATPDQLRQNLTHLDAPIPPALWQALTTRGLIPS
ncbi:D-threo-aldose 1-dehydrogenase [Kribbella sp. VKM Ac-2569]|uniref:aldo/keto reductase n=1 Tax=Kribbella sp. VKM Ac-2569 TaxID=2512220 RepID=UPI00102C4BC6|nr:aldo/keto reductase [Kribbella sp. VKM Ac-2569]RZT27648.1 D-threo-aldose 1-dehydrogenase [Kribbella sp. VKM Ac-2569]